MIVVLLTAVAVSVLMTVLVVVLFVKLARANEDIEDLFEKVYNHDNSLNQFNDFHKMKSNSKCSRYGELQED